LVIKFIHQTGSPFGVCRGLGEPGVLGWGDLAGAARAEGPDAELEPLRAALLEAIASIAAEDRAKLADAMTQVAEEARELAAALRPIDPP
jgi:hypothetical protein